MILFNGSQLPTTFISPQSVSAQISDGLIAFPGTRNITVITPDGKYSNMIALNVQEPPKPTFKYIGMIARKRYNNDTAYFEEPGKEDPVGARLNDIVAGRFRLKSISAEEVVFEDVSLGFRHKLELNRPAPGRQFFDFARKSASARGGSVYQPYTPPNPNVHPPQGDCPPGIPCNTIPRYIPPTPRPTQDSKQDDVDDADGDEKP